MNTEQQLAHMAMMEEALKEIASEELYGNGKAQYRMKKVAVEALSASPESLKKWEAEKLEPLQKQVAMLRHIGEYGDMGEWKEALSNTQATAEAFMREHDAKVLEEEADSALEHIDGSDMCDEEHNKALLWYANTLKRRAAEICAANKE